MVLMQHYPRPSAHGACSNVYRKGTCVRLKSILYTENKMGGTGNYKISYRVLQGFNKPYVYRGIWFLRKKIGMKFFRF